MKKSFAIVAALLTALSTQLVEAVGRPAGLVDLTSPSGKASSSVTFYKGTAARVFQDNADITGGGDKVRIIYDKTKSENEIGRFVYTFDEAMVVNSYGIGLMNADTQCNGREPGVWKFYGSNDYDGKAANIGSATWVELDSREVTDWMRGEYKYFEFENATAYTSYMLAISAGQPTAKDQYIQFAYLEFFNNDLADISNAYFHRVQNGNWKAEMTMGGTMPETVYLDLSALNAETVSIALPADGILSGDTLAAVDKTIAYSASYRAVSASGQVAVCKLPGKYFFGDYAAKTPADYAKTFSVAVADDVVGTGVNMVVPVRLSEAAISGFSYSDFQQADYGDLLVTDEFGNALPYEVASWNPAGESLLWVRFPRVAAGSVIQFYYGGPSADVVPARTWESYTGVWHLDELTGETGTSPDATGHELDVTVNTAIDTTGRFGNGRKINTTTGFASNGTSVVPAGRAMSVPSYSSYQLGDTFTISGWFYHDGGYYYDKLFSRSGGLTFQYNAWNGYQNILVGGASTVKMNAWSANIDAKKWVKYLLAYDGKTVNVYTNGALAASVVAGAAVDNDELLCIGGTKDHLEKDTTTVYAGTVDEIRLIDETMNGERVLLGYQMETRSDVLVFGPVSGTGISHALIVASNIDGMGECNPALGVHENQTAVEAEPGDVVAKDGVVYDVAKYTIATSDDAGLSWSDPVEHEGRSYSYVPDGKFTRLTWIWEPVACAIQTTSSHPTGSISYSADPVYTIDGVDYYAAGTVLTATDPAAESFAQWQDAGDGISAAGNVATLIGCSMPVRMTAVSRHKWIFKDGVLSDGSWRIAATADKTKKTELTVGAEVLANSPCGVLDFTAGIESEDGENTYTLVKFSNSIFKGNTVLREVYLAPGLQQFGWYTFQGCTSLTTFSPLLPSTLSNSNNGQVFDGCTSLTGDVVHASEAVTSWGNKMFANTKVTSFTSPTIMDLSSGQMFDSCTMLTNVSMPSIVKIGTRTFRGCTALKSVTLGESLETLGNESFVNCSALTTVTPLLPDSLKTIGTSAFENCSLLTGDLSLKSLGLISEKSFNHTSLSSVNAPAATNVQKYAFNACSTLTNVTYGADSVDLSGYCPITGNAKTQAIEFYFPGSAPKPAFGNGGAFGAYSYSRIYCDPQMDPVGWSALMDSAWFAEATDAEKARADYPGPKTLGVITTKGDVNNKSWLIRYRSPLRKPGLLLLVR